MQITQHDISNFKRKMKQNISKGTNMVVQDDNTTLKENRNNVRDCGVNEENTLMIDTRSKSIYKISDG